ncbi:MAG: DUF2103 domain-containing protein [bacterium]
MKNHVTGESIGGKHTTAIDGAKELIDKLSKIPEIKRVVASTIRILKGRSANRKIKVFPANGGVRIEYIGNIYRQAIVVYSDQGFTWLEDRVKVEFDKLNGCQKRKHSH